MDKDTLASFIKKCLETFHKRRLDRARSLTLKDVLRRKNPYLFRALGMRTPAEFVERLLDDHMSASDEAVFSNTVFKPLAIFVAGGRASNLSGIDFFLEQGDSVKAVNLISGPNVQNSSQRKKQEDYFRIAKAQVEINKKFDGLLGHAYGKQNTELKNGQSFRDRSGQALWEELTGDSEFYLEIIQLMGDAADEYRQVFTEAKYSLVKRFTQQFENEFTSDTREVDWDRLTRFVSDNPNRTFGRTGTNQSARLIRKIG